MFLNFLTNPWTIAVGAAVIAGLILRYVFGIRKSDTYNVESQNQQGGITAGRVEINVTNIPDAKISIEKLLGNEAHEQGYQSKFLLKVDTTTPINNLYVQANADGIISMRVCPQRSGMAMLGLSGTRAGYAFTNIPSAYGDYKIIVVTDKPQEIAFDISRE